MALSSPQQHQEAIVRIPPVPRRIQILNIAHHVIRALHRLLGQFREDHEVGLEGGHEGVPKVAKFVEAMMVNPVTLTLTYLLGVDVDARVDHVEDQGDLAEGVDVVEVETVVVRVVEVVVTMQVRISMHVKQADLHSGNPTPMQQIVGLMSLILETWMCDVDSVGLCIGWLSDM
jgi:hypothetical protein